ncbi:MAG: glycosyltransferase [Bacteroidetes bacterium]|nr:glycosyltransferase [Bacteroidota bacterium]
MKLSVIIVNYNVRYFLEQCLLSALKALRGIDGEIIVVDNNSVDGSVEMVQRKFPDVICIANQDNTGFSKANNQAIKISKGEYVLLLNPDTVVEENTFELCLNYLNNHPDTGALGVKMIDGSGKFLPESKRGLPTPEVALYKMIGLNKIFKKSKRFGKYHMGFIGENETAEVDVLAGAYMMIRKSVLDKIGLLDETFFMYGEDIDLSYRITQAGYKNIYFPQTSIIHYKGESTKKMSVNYVFIFYRAMVIFAKKHYKGKNARLLIFFINTAIWGRALLAVVQRFISKSWIYFADVALLAIGLLAIKDYWEEHIKLFHTFSPKLVYLHFPYYILIWISALYINGGYKQPWSARRVLRGVFTGSVLIIAVYGLLPEELRYSRGIIVIGSIWAAISLLGIRLLAHYFQYKNFRLGSGTETKTVIVGAQGERERVMQLLKSGMQPVHFLGYVSTVDETTNDEVLGKLNRLDDICNIYGVNEVIFCARDVSTADTLNWMKKIGSGKVHFKIVPEERYFIIGSHSKDLNGELFTEEIRFALNDDYNCRNKRLFDVLSSLFFFIFSPVLVWFSNGIGKYYQSVYSVFRKRKTWVGYDTTVGTDHLPKLKSGVFTVSDQHQSELDGRTREKLNFFYAKNYHPEIDLAIVWKNLFQKR